MKSFWEWIKNLFCNDDEPEEPEEPNEPTKPVEKEPVKPIEPGSDNAAWEPTLEKFQILHVKGQRDLEGKLDEDTKIVVLELSQLTPSMVQWLHTVRVRVIAYFSASFEKWRDDAKLYPEDAKGKKMSGWNELWGDLTKDSLKDFLTKRMDLAKSYGCDAIEIDNTDIAWNKVGFSVTPQENYEALVDLSDRAHARGLAIFLKNTGDIAEELSEHFDGVLNESCAKYNECHDFNSFIEKGKPCFGIEYRSKDLKPRDGWRVQYKEDDEYFGNDFERAE